ncbi:LysR family transcriptional regulator [Cellvibrio japonicus]|uniref:Transcriptional regulator, LysR family n=1 Tax=Cellvibrio japonicus (strain Ueda107) TaxID=498211 RepID=B3PLI7_CELJU|nr:LysR family transcriptional regulator [Cellvibrio japonicus]ACE83527.1 transcriptional regulator, LysR family [Cellvibrio japonicus Ueda107]QEI12974.1 LysR family transcriptional regulator [Cellvibrio japonicus]QEI16548.1 LysR family transcriptional regulator [Cellvibrio japonicus]QEI20126.1 LysR family transcriptional regulator [Cellvibrio japonicus]
MRYTLRQLEIFVAIAQLGSVSRAAEQIAISQSAASTALAELERQFDCQLFDRHGKLLILNALGRSLLSAASSLLSQAQEIEQLLEGKTALGNLKVGATLTIGNYLAILIISEFMQHHAECHIDLQVKNTKHILQQIASYELDLGLIEGSCHHPELVAEPWLDDELAVFCAPGHPLANRAEPHIEDLVAATWILREQGSGTRETFDHAMRHHASALKVRLELEHTEAIKRAVESGLGIGCISRLALRDAVRRGSLVEIKTPMLDLQRQFMFVWHKNRYQTPAMIGFLDYCRSLTGHLKTGDDLLLPATT